jgi:hypothetical protein
VPSEQKADVRGKGTYPLRSEMTPLEYLTDDPYKCGAEDVNVADFAEAATIIRGHNVVEEFLAYGMSHPDSEKWNWRLYLCVQDVQITCIANNMVNKYNISINYKLRSYKMTLGSERRLQSGMKI